MTQAIPPMSPAIADMRKPAVARIWEGRTREGNLGVQVFRRTHDGIAEFMTISYPNHLPKDAEYLLELPSYVKHFDILVNE
jgi:hypothetical protein